MNNIKLFVANYLLLIASEMELIILVDPFCFAYGPRATAMKKPGSALRYLSLKWSAF